MYESNPEFWQASELHFYGKLPLKTYKQIVDEVVEQSKPTELELKAQELDKEVK